MAKSPVEVANLAKDATPLQEVDPVTRERQENLEFDRFPDKPAEIPAVDSAIPPVEKPVETKLTPKHSQYAIRRALKYGASLDEINNVDEAYLENWLEMKDAEVASPAKQAQQPKAEPDEDEIDVLAREQSWDARFTKMQKDRRDENKKILEANAKRDEKEKRREAIEAAQTFDDAFDSLGPKFAAVFGEGSGLDMKVDDEFRQRRVAAIQASNYDPQKDSPTQIKRKIAAAAKRLFGANIPADEPVETDPYSAAENGKVKNGHYTKEQLAASTIAKPTQKTERPKVGREAALAAANDWYKKNPKAIPEDTGDIDDD